MRSRVLPGYVILAVLILPVAGLAQDIVRCSSDDMRRHYCDVGPNREIRFAHQASDAKCIPNVSFGVEQTRVWVDRGCRGDFQVFRLDNNNNNDRGNSGNRGWGWGRNGSGNRGRWDNQGSSTVSMTCSSNDGYHSCPAQGQILSARVARQRSGSSCQENYSWGYRGSTLWVDHGCRADFELSVRDGGTGGGWMGRDSARGRTFNMRCGSDDEGYNTCAVDGEVIRARMVHQNSGSPCVAGRTWGYRREGIWVDRGCRAEFEVTTR